jgi:predicted phosphoribosyltransferase
VICLERPLHFDAVSKWYLDFGQLTDADVARVLAAYQGTAEHQR